MLKKIIKIFIILIITLLSLNAKTYAVVGEDINKKITNWSSGAITGVTDEAKKEIYQKILNNLRDTFQYDGSTINKEMKVNTTISVIDKKKTLLGDGYKYTIRIRNRNK